MGFWVRILFGLVALAFASPFFAMLSEPFFSALLAELDIDTSQWARPVVMFGGSLVSELWFQLLTAGIVGAAIGAWSHWAATRFDRRTAATEAALRKESRLMLKEQRAVAAVIPGAKEIETAPAKLPPPTVAAVKLLPNEIAPAIGVLAEIDAFLAGEVEHLIRAGVHLSNWRRTIKLENGHAEYMEEIASVRDEKNRRADDLRALLRKHSYHLELLGMDFGEIPKKLDRWHRVLQELVQAAAHIPKFQGSELDRYLNPPVAGVSKEVGETENLVNSKRADIKAKRREINPA